MFDSLTKFILKKTTLDNTNKLSFDNFKTYCKVVKVYDGDTITINMIVFGKPRQFNIRMFGYNSPEIRTRDLEEKQKGFEAQQFLHQILFNKIVYIHCHDFDKYGRLLGTIYLFKHDVNDYKDSINQFMIDNNHGTVYMM